MIHRRPFKLRLAFGLSVIVLGVLAAASVSGSTGVAGTGAEGHGRRAAPGGDAIPIPREVGHSAKVGRPAGVFIYPTRARVLTGQQMLFTAVAVDEAGTPIMAPGIRWTVSGASAGSVDASGLFTAARGQGIQNGTVMASVGDGGDRIAASAAVEVTERLPGEVRTLDRVVPYPSSATVRAGQFIGLAALAWDGRERWVRDVEWEWSVVDDRAGEIDRFGFFTASARMGTYPDAVRVTATQRTGGVILRRYAFVAVTVAGEAGDDQQDAGEHGPR